MRKVRNLGQRHIETLTLKATHTETYTHIESDTHRDTDTHR